MRCLSASRVQHAISTHRLSLRQRQPLHELAVAGGALGERPQKCCLLPPPASLNSGTVLQPSNPPPSPQLQLPCRERRRRAAGCPATAG